MMPLGNLLSTGLGQALQLMLLIIAPVLVFAFVVHLLERLIQGRLVSRFGWRSVLWTGWLGTPVHEMSHVLFCIIFRHRIKEIGWWKPDRDSGRLGYVHHAYQSGNWYQEIGNVFIGIAPLLGGTVALLLLLSIFYPGVVRAALESQVGDTSFWTMVFTSVGSLLGGLFTWQNLGTIRFWLFLYLVICVGSHMAPSLSDYRGALKGGLVLLGLLLAFCVAMSLLTPSPITLYQWLAPWLVPVTTVLILVVLLCILATAVVFLITDFKDRVTGK